MMYREALSEKTALLNTGASFSVFELDFKLYQL